MPFQSNQPSSGMAQIIFPRSALSDITFADQVDTRSLQENLSKSIGRFVVCKCLIGTNNISTVTGILKSAGTSFFILLDPCTGAETTCDLYSLKFITAYPEGIPDFQLYCNRRLYDQEWVRKE